MSGFHAEQGKHLLHHKLAIEQQYSECKCLDDIFVDPKADDFLLEPGLVPAIEPMVNAGSKKVKTLSDGWTVVTADSRLCAHFEHTIAITEDGAEVLTAGPWFE